MAQLGEVYKVGELPRIAEIFHVCSVEDVRTLKSQSLISFEYFAGQVSLMLVDLE